MSTITNDGLWRIEELRLLASRLGLFQGPDTLSACLACVCRATGLQTR